MTMITDRRDLLKAMMAAGGMSAGFVPSIVRALEIPGNHRRGTIADVEHVVIFTQENRAFDHYFGALNGVRGFADRFVLPSLHSDENGRRHTIFVQPDERPDSHRDIGPFHLDTKKDLRLIRLEGTPHSLPNAQAAWDQGRMSGWPLAKHNHSMGYFKREDIPFQYALAEAFTLCDAYHCSFHGGTNPNRLFIWTGTNDPMARGNGPAIDNSYDNFSDPFGHGGYSWITYPERLLNAGISFKIYQDMADNFDDNPLEGFWRFREGHANSSGEYGELAQRTLTTRTLDQFKADVLASRLPQVSWIVAPAKYSEHPGPSSPVQGADYTARVLDALTANPDVWARTVLFLNFDENDGLFDHVPPPAPPSRDSNEPTVLIGGSTVPVDDNYHMHAQGDGDRPYLNRPYGLGPRVPMFAVSPWSRGGFVASETFDHTSVIRFLETRFGVHEPNISAWRRAVCGDLTSCFDFNQSDERSFMSALPAMQALSRQASQMGHIRPIAPQQMDVPIQEAGLRRRRPTPYVLEAALVRADETAIEVELTNGSSERAAVFQLYDVNDLTAIPRRFTVGAGLTTRVALPRNADGRHDSFLLGPNGFHRRFIGQASGLTVRLSHAPKGSYASGIAIVADPLRQLVVRDMAYGQSSYTIMTNRDGAAFVPLNLRESHGWYDLQVDTEGESVRLAGHIEDGKPSFSDPVAHGPAALNF